MNNSGQVTVHQILVWAAIILITGWLLWSATHSSHTTSSFGSGTTNNDNHSTRWPFTLDFNFSCVPQKILDQEAERNKNVSTNSVK
jgi:hypothetical protein